MNFQRQPKSICGDASAERLLEPRPCELLPRAVPGPSRGPHLIPALPPAALGLFSHLTSAQVSLPRGGRTTSRCWSDTWGEGEREEQPLVPGNGERLRTDTRTCGTSGREGCGRRWSRRGGAVPREQSPASRPHPLRCLSLGSDTKSSRSVPSAWRRCPSDRGRGGRRAGGGAARRAGPGAGLQALPAPPRSPRRASG